MGAFGCAEEPDPLPQWIVYIGTDAPLPAFGDRVRVEMLDAGGTPCAGCTRVFDIASGAALPLSLGVVPPPTGVARLRVRLYRSELTDALGQPLDPVIDAYGALPPLGDGPADTLAVLSMSCFGEAATPSEGRSCDPARGAQTTGYVFPTGDPSALPQPGSWGPVANDCTSDAPVGMVCIPGGVFLLGTRVYAPFGPSFDPVPEQLVHVSPFFLDRDELTVGELRSLGPIDAPPPATNDFDPNCRYMEQPGAYEAYGVNCLSRATADAACRVQGKRLPSEAEWEYAAGSRSLDAPFPWWPFNDPSNEALCQQAVLARDDSVGSGLCLLVSPGLPVGSQAGGSASDVSPLGLRNLGGNLSEWVADDFARYSDPTCWGPDLRLRTDPVCVVDGSEGVARGGSWRSIPYDAHVTFRLGANAAIREPRMGVRCAADAHE